MSSNMKICLNCGDKLLEQAKKCPHCGKNAKNFPLVDKNDDDTIKTIIASVPNPKSGLGKWKENLDYRDMTLKESIKASFSVNSKEKIIAGKERVKQLEAEKRAYCPKCHSTDLSAHKKGFGVGKAVVGGLLVGPVGLAAGGIGSGKVTVTCLKCGRQFKPGSK